MRYSFIFIFLFIGLAACSHRHKLPIEEELPQVFEYPHRKINLPLDKQYKKGLIIIDAGHGGKDLGTFSKKKDKYQEKDLNLSTAVLLKKSLIEKGYDVEMTREGDSFISLEKRASFANRKDPMLFISIHFNSAQNANANGVEIFYYSAQNDRSKQSQQLAKRILEKVIAHTEANSRGIKKGDFAVIRETHMPAVLIEGGFLTNEEERKKIKTKNYLKKLTLGIAEGVDAFVLGAN